jgi:hypothetical protein
MCGSACGRVLLQCAVVCGRAHGTERAVSAVRKAVCSRALDGVEQYGSTFMTVW